MYPYIYLRLYPDLWSVAHFSLTVKAWNLGASTLLALIPFIFPVAGNGVLTWMVVLGLFALIAPLLTQTEPPVLAHPGDGGHAHEGVGGYDASRR